jgi:hypothetical protein
MYRLEEQRRPLLRLTIEIGRDRRPCYAAPAPQRYYAAPPQQRYYQPAPRCYDDRDRTRFDYSRQDSRLSFERSSPRAYSFPGAYSGGNGCPPGGCPTPR